MNLLAKRLLLPIVAAAFFLMCEDPGEIGIQEAIPNQFDVNFVDLPLNPKTIFIDSVNSTNSSSLFFGSYSDPSFGKVSAVPYIEFLIPDFSFGIPQNAVFDSIILHLDVNYAYGPNLLEPITLTANRFDGEIEDRLHYTRDSLPTRVAIGPQRGVLGTKIFSYNPDSTRVIDFKLSDQFGQQLMTDVIRNGDSTFLIQDRFRNYFNGLKIASTSNSSIFGYDPLSDSTRMSLYYHYEDLGLMFNDIHQFRIRRGFTNITSDYSGTPLQNIGGHFSEVEPMSNTAYYNPALGLFIKLDLSSVYNFKDTATNVIVNRADLVLDVGISPSLDPPAEIRFYLLTSRNRFIISDFSFVPRSLHTEAPEVLFEPTIADRPLPFRYDSINHKYSEQVTFYIKNLMTDKLTDSTLLALPNGPLRDATKTDSIYYPRVNSVNQLTLPKNQLKLRVYYSKFD